MMLLTLAGRVGTVTATWHAEFKRYLLTVTTPTIMPSTVGPYDTYVLETPSLTEGPFRVVSYMYVQPHLPRTLSLFYIENTSVHRKVCRRICSRSRSRPSPSPGRTWGASGTIAAQRRQGYGCTAMDE